MSEKKTVREIVADELYAQKTTDSEIFPFLSGVIRGAGELHFTREGFALEVRHRDVRLIEEVVDAIESAYGEKLSYDGTDVNVGYAHSVFYSVVVPQNVSGKLLESAKIVKNKYEFYNEIPEGFLAKARDKKAFLKGLYLSCGSVKVPEENDSITSKGYTFALSLNSDQVRPDIMKLIAKASKISPDLIKIKGTGSGIYVKSSEAICEILTAMGCVVSPLALYDIMAERQLRNKVNREQNSEMGNLQKAVNASVKQAEAIAKLKETGAYETLSFELKETCEKRLAFPEMTVTALAAQFDPPITKSCINHRLRKIVELAGNAKGKQGVKNKKAKK